MMLVSSVSLKHMKKTSKKLLASTVSESMVLSLPGIAKTFGMVTMTVKYHLGKYVSLKCHLFGPLSFSVLFNRMIDIGKLSDLIDKERGCVDFIRSSPAWHEFTVG